MKNVLSFILVLSMLLSGYCIPAQAGYFINGYNSDYYDFDDEYFDDYISAPWNGGGFENNSGSFSDTPQQGQNYTNPDGMWGDVNNTHNHIYELCETNRVSHREIPGNDYVHYYMNYLLDKCIICGDISGDYVEGTWGTEEHHFDGDSICDDCGYVKVCSHNNRKREYDSGRKEPIEGNNYNHYAVTYDMSVCVDCGEILERHIIREMKEESHVFANNTCKYCGYVKNIAKPQYNKIYTYPTPLTTWTIYPDMTNYSVPMYSLCDEYSAKVANSIASVQCKILEFYDNGWCKVTCELGTGYVPIYQFILNYGTNKWVAPYKKAITLDGTINVNKRVGEPINGWTVTKWEDSPLTVVADNGNAPQVIYKITGKNEYKMGWVELRIFENPSYSYNVNWETNSVDTTSNPYFLGYATYNGIAYWNWVNPSTGKQLSSQRRAVLDKAKNMVTVLWKNNNNTFPTWRATKSQPFALNTVEDTDGALGLYFEHGKTYMGIPYAMRESHNTYDDVAWINFLQDKNFDTQVVYDEGHGPSVGKGIDCSGFVYKAIQATGQTIEHLNSTNIYNCGKYYREIIPLGKIGEEYYDNLLIPGDIFASPNKEGFNRHVVIYVGKDSSGCYWVFESVADKSKCSYSRYTKAGLKKYNAVRFKGFDWYD